MIPLDERVILSKIALLQAQRDFKISSLHKRGEDIEEQCRKISNEYNERIEKLNDQLKMLRM